jgi:hypothetical protein
MRRSVWTALLATGVAALLLACGGGPDRSKANLRLVNATSGYEKLDLLVDGSRRFSEVAVGATDRYVELDPDEADSVLTRPGSSTPLVSLTPAVKEDKHYTLLAYGSEGELKTVLLDDNADAESGKARLRVVNAAPGAGNVDVYVTGTDEPLSSAVALQAGAAVGTVGGYTTLNAAIWRLRITGAGDKTDLRLDVSGVALSRGQVATLVVKPSAGGLLVNALVLTQQGGITALTSTQARVRVAAPNSGTVSASVPGTVLLSAAAAPVVGPYKSLPAGEQTVAMTVDNAPVAVPVKTLAPGTDWTLLVYLAGAAPAAAWVEDDNRLPDAATGAKLRLVHGVGGLSGALSLTANLLPVASNVAVGTASAYGAVTAGTTVLLTVNAAGTSEPVVKLVEQTLEAGGVYSLFVLPGAAPGAGVLRRDR